MIFILILSIKFVAVGDVLLDRGVKRYVNRFGMDSLFSSVEGIIESGDISLCNLESPVTKTGMRLNKPYCFRGEIEYLKGLCRAGFNLFNLANNHTRDWGEEGFVNTIRNIENIEGMYTGGGFTQFDAEKPAIITNGEITIAVFGTVELFSRKYRDAIFLKSGPACLNMNSLIKQIKLIRPFVDYIILTIHWGKEYQDFPEKEQIEKAHRLIDAGVDMVIGHHPHVIQGVEVYKGRPIFYSLGNFVFDQKKPVQRETFILRFTLKKTEITNIRLIPVLITDCKPGLPDNKMAYRIKNRIIKTSYPFGTKFFNMNGKILPVSWGNNYLRISNTHITAISSMIFRNKKTNYRLYHIYPEKSKNRKSEEII